MSLKLTFFLIGVINIVEGLLGFSLSEVYIRHWHQVTNLEASIWLLSGVIFIYLSKRKTND
ncbi:MAG: hypothetical protein WCY75_07145 [Sulfurimonadaceae bacterium]|jgi:hypothetical protein